MAKKSDPKPPKDYVDYGDAGTDKRADASSADTQSFTATTTASLITGAVVYLNKLKDRGTIPKGWFQQRIDYLKRRLGRNPVGRPVGSGFDLSHYLDRIEKIIEDEDADDFGVAARMVAEEEGLKPNTNRWDSFIRSLQREQKIRHPDNNS